MEQEITINTKESINSKTNFKHYSMANLETTYLGIKLKNPLVAASSGLTSSIEKIKELAEAGIGAIE